MNIEKVLYCGWWLLLIGAIVSLLAKIELNTRK